MNEEARKSVAVSGDRSAAVVKAERPPATLAAEGVAAWSGRRTAVVRAERPPVARAEGRFRRPRGRRSREANSGDPRRRGLGAIGGRKGGSNRPLTARVYVLWMRGLVKSSYMRTHRRV